MNIVDRKKWNDIINVILNTNFTANFSESKARHMPAIQVSTQEQRTRQELV